MVDGGGHLITTETTHTGKVRRLLPGIIAFSLFHHAKILTLIISSSLLRSSGDQ
jgi:hypothetical protein